MPVRLRRPGLAGRVARAEQRQDEILAELRAIRTTLEGYKIPSSLKRLELGVNAAVRGVFLGDAELDHPFALTARRFRLGSQNEEDGMNFALFSAVGTTSRRFVEIGCGSNGGNSGFLARELGWNGVMVDGDEEKVAAVRRGVSAARVTVTNAFVTIDNVNDLIADGGLEGEIDLLSVDIDGIDLWIWKAIDRVSPRVVVCEYNGAFGAEEPVTVPYDPSFTREGFYYGASLPALVNLGRSRGYRLVAVEPRGVNAYFLREDVGPQLAEVAARDVIRVEQRVDRRLLDRGLRPGTELIASLKRPFVRVDEDGTSRVYDAA
jgi:hypothetical protein